VSFANGVHMSLRVAARLEREGVRCRVVDLRWLAPLPVEDLLREAAATGRVLVVDETRRTGGVSRRSVTALVDGGFRGVSGAWPARTAHPARRRGAARAAVGGDGRGRRLGARAGLTTVARRRQR
jgi:hypothetical protein